MAYVFTNKAITFLITNLGSTATTVVVGSGEGDKFPVLSAGDVSPIVFEDRATGRFEIAYMTARTGDTITLVRGQEGTLAASWPVGTNMSLRATAEIYNEVGNHEERITDNENAIAGLVAQDIAAIAINAIYPVGAIYMSTASANPAGLLGVGTWQPYAAGRALVGVGTADGEAWLGGQEKGAATHTLLPTELAGHTHTVDIPSTTVSSHNEGFGFHIQRGDESQDIIFSPTNISIRDAGNANTVSSSNNPTRASRYLEWNINHSHTFDVPPFQAQLKGSDQPHNNIQPSIGVYVWKRTA